jgi:hypothetical protein
MDVGGVGFKIVWIECGIEVVEEGLESWESLRGGWGEEEGSGDVEHGRVGWDEGFGGQDSTLGWVRCDLD